MGKIKAYGICLYKRENKSIKILLCKSINSHNKWGFLKGVELEGETKKQTATREFFEESSIKIPQYLLENYFEQENPTKDIGIFLVNFDKIKKINVFFMNGKLYNRYLSWENSEVKFFDIKNLPTIKKKQKKLLKDITRYLNKG